MKTQRINILSEFLIICFLAIVLVQCNKNSDDPVDPIPDDPVVPMAWAVGNQDSTGHAIVLFSADSGNTWTRQGLGSPLFQGADANDLFILDSNNVWVVCSNNTIARTTDGGDNWNKVDSPFDDDIFAFSSICIVDGTDIWVSGRGGDIGFVCKSTDEGNTWTVYDANMFQEYLMQGIWAVNSQIVYVVGNNGLGSWLGVAARTMDGGTTWDSITFENQYNKDVGWIGVRASDENHVVIHGGNGHYAHTTDGGTNWNNDSIYDNASIGLDVNDLIMLDESTWWSAIDYDHISITFDKGSTWTEQPSDLPSNMFLLGISAYDTQLALISAGSAGYPLGGKIMQTTDGGNTWVTKHITDNMIWKVAFVPH